MRGARDGRIYLGGVEWGGVGFIDWLVNSLIDSDPHHRDYQQYHEHSHPPLCRVCLRDCILHITCGDEVDLDDDAG